MRTRACAISAVDTASTIRPQIISLSHTPHSLVSDTPSGKRESGEVNLSPKMLFPGQLKDLMSNRFTVKANLGKSQRLQRSLLLTVFQGHFAARIHQALMPVVNSVLFKACICLIILCSLNKWQDWWPRADSAFALDRESSTPTRLGLNQDGLQTCTGPAAAQPLPGDRSCVHASKGWIRCIKQEG